MIEPRPLCILVTLHPGGMTSEQHLAGEAIDVTADGHVLDQWEDGAACWHIVKSEVAEAVRLELEYLKEEEE